MKNNADDGKLKLCCVASAGGHWEELLCLKDIFEENDSFYITEETEQVMGSALPSIYLVPQINRHERFFMMHFIRLFKKAFQIMREEKPDVVITTGALIAFPFCVLAKLSKKKIIFIESFARIHNKSLTGRLVYPFADLFIVQWKSMLKCYPKAIYAGGIF